MQSWYERDTRRYQQELQALDNIGIKYTEDAEKKAQGILRLNLTIEKGHELIVGLDSKLDLTAEFPKSYPYFRTEVFAPQLELPRHQNPILKNLCLLPRATSAWGPDDTLAGLLTSQLPKVIEKGNITSPEVLSNDAAEQAEPISEYFQPDFVVLFDTTSFDAGAPTVKGEIAGKVRFSALPLGDKEIPRLLISKSLTPGNAELSTVPDALIGNASKEVGVGIIIRTNEPPPFEAKEFIEWLKSCGLRNALQQCRSLKIGGSILEYLIGVNFPEETGPGQLGSGWIFFAKIKHGGSTDQFSTIYGKALRLNKGAFNQRIPKLSPIGDKKITVVGLGALGASCAIDFARNGIGHLTLVDYDFVDPPTTIRWALGIEFAGLNKANSLKRFIEKNYPYTSVSVLPLRIGQVGLLSGENETDEDLQRVFSTSLLFDATAEKGVMHYLSQEAKLREIPYIQIEASEGAVGGQIIRVNPGKAQGCWMCLQHAQYNGQIPIPPNDSSGKVQAVGCGDLSFTGTSFDLQNISTAGVRLAISTLCEGAETGYPQLDWDVSVLSLVDATGKAISPLWQDYSLAVHPNCPYCAHKE